MFRLLAVAVTTVLFLLSSAISDGYEAKNVKDGASIKGTVLFSGTPPEDETILIHTNTYICGEKKKAGKYIVNEKRVKNVVVWIDGVTGGKAVPRMSVPVTIKECQAEPHVSVGFVGGEYVFRNEDSILHTVQLKLGLAYQKEASGRPLEYGATAYNVAMPRKDMEIRKPIKNYHRYSKDTGFINITSNTHTWISGYIYIFDHPYAAVTDEKGSFKIDGIPAGEYTLKFWHEGFGTLERKIKVLPGEVKELTIEFPDGEKTSSVGNGGVPSVRFTETRHDFGTIKEGDIVSHNFEFVNDGSDVLRIIDLIPA